MAAFQSSAAPKDGCNNSTPISARNLVPELSEALHARYADDDAAWDAPATISRVYAGWPFVASAYHPLFGTVGVSDESELPTVLGAMRYLLGETEPDMWVRHADLPKVAPEGERVAL